MEPSARCVEDMMPEMYFRVRWPNGAVQRCYSPSTVIEEHFESGTEYAIGDFVEHARRAFGIASERVRAKYGFGCAVASQQLAEIESIAAAYADEPKARVVVEALLAAYGSRR
jgi:uncharacterized repeat protein (TIGR04042 family)